MHDVRRIIETGRIGDDEDWWTVKYSKNAPHPNCIVGEAFVVHFSYFTTEKQMLDLGLLKEFENIVRMELGDKLLGDGQLPSFCKVTLFFTYIAIDETRTEIVYHVITM